MTVFGVDFFCGVGGATSGFQNAGLQILKGIDNDPTCRETYERNCHPSIFELADVNRLEPKEVVRGFQRSERDFLVLIACAPCQPFSRFLTNRRSRRDYRTSLILRFAEFAKQLVPDAIFIENVPGFENPKKGGVLNELLDILESRELDYECVWKLVDAKSYGVPQTRLRFIMLASRFGKIGFPPETHGEGLLPFKTVRDAIAEYPPIAAEESHNMVANHAARKLSSLNMKRMKNTPKDGGSRRDWPMHLWLKCHRRDGSGHSDVYGRMNWDKPSSTLTCKCNSITNGRFGHPSQNRAISLREAAALQTFPDEFVFYGFATDIARHIGNAVPPLIAETFGKTICRHLESNRQPIVAANAHLPSLPS